MTYFNSVILNLFQDLPFHFSLSCSPSLRVRFTNPANRIDAMSRGLGGVASSKNLQIIHIVLEYSRPRKRPHTNQGGNKTSTNKRPIHTGSFILSEVLSLVAIVFSCQNEYKLIPKENSSEPEFLEEFHTFQGHKVKPPLPKENGSEPIV